jgi:hypothetical protein
MPRGVRFAEWVCGAIPLGLLRGLLFGYAWLARKRFRREPAVQEALDEFMERRTELDRQAARHRLHLIAENDPAAPAQASRVPVYALSGVLDPLVPWFCARSWLGRNCRDLRAYRVLLADHNVLSTASRRAARQVLEWMTGA